MDNTDYLALKEEAEKRLKELGVTYTLEIFQKGYCFMFYYNNRAIYRIYVNKVAFDNTAYQHLYNLANNFSLKMYLYPSKTLLEYCIDKPIGMDNKSYSYTLLKD